MIQNAKKEIQISMGGNGIDSKWQATISHNVVMLHTRQTILSTIVPHYSVAMSTMSFLPHWSTRFPPEEIFYASNLTDAYIVARRVENKGLQDPKYKKYYKHYI